MENTVDPVSYTPMYDDETTKILENNFSRTKEECYLDHAGATLYSDSQIKNIAADLHNTLYANPHSVGTASSMTQDVIERTRYLVLNHFHTSPDDYTVIFTSSATASLKIVADTFLFAKEAANGALPQGGQFVYTQDNHTSVLGMREVVANRGAKVTCLKHDDAFKVFGASPPSTSSQHKSNSLFVYPAQCNFSGLKYPLQWISDVHNGILSSITDGTASKWYVLLDAAAFVSTCDLDLSIYKPDFVTLSFYKMFGYPTGIGALLVKNSSASALHKLYYGGGTVDVSLSSEMFHVKRESLHQRFEDGTVPFLSIASLRHGLDILSAVKMQKISHHVFSLARFLHESLLKLHHGNGKPVAKLYSDTAYENCDLQGGIVAFNLIRSNSEYVGYMEVLNMAALFKIHLRTGCFCNPGACQRHLALSNNDVLQNYDAGYVCGGAADLINGRPTGAVRVSFGYMSTLKDVQTLLFMIKECFVDGPQVNKIPDWWLSYKAVLHNKYSRKNTNVQKTHHMRNNETNGINNKLQSIRESVSHFINGHQFSNLTIDNGVTTKKCTLEQLYIYPIKSCAAYQIKGSWSLNSKGLQYDREWMIVTSTGTCLTQKQNISLCLLRPVISKETRIMQLNYPGMPVINVPLDNSFVNTIEGTVCQSRICGHKVEGTDCGSEVSEWLSLALGLPNLRLIRQSNSGTKQKDGNKPDLSFSSQAQYLLINKASVLWLSDKVSDTEVQKDTIIHRFRGNMVLNGCEAFEETKWKHVCIGRNKFVVTGPCTRCQMICIDQTTGLKTVEPLRTLAEQFHGKLRFGIYLTKESREDGIIAIGDTVRIS
ncbi:molybdenum cofactor sulfurase isoform X1 [Lasioglossum baleicum]|uniref:molybdenum cofactor sulfurase isoform X1 n=1 Tax=Lasioglossum baleicum TaxID=434251 RepID=UPI003FCE814A